MGRIFRLFPIFYSWEYIVYTTQDDDEINASYKFRINIIWASVMLYAADWLQNRLYSAAHKGYLHDSY